MSQVVLNHERNIVVDSNVVEMSLRVANEAFFFRFQKHLFHLFLLQSDEQQNPFIFETYAIQKQMFHLQ